MLSSIHPLGERGRGNRFSKTAVAFALGSLVGGLLIGSLTGALGLAIRTAVRGISSGTVGAGVSLVIVALAGVAAIGFDLSGKQLPSAHRQVNEDWLVEYRGWVYGFGFGFQLGTGVATYITSGAVLLWLTAMVVSGSVAASVLIGATFGLARGLSIVAARSIDTPERLVSIHRSLHRSAPLVQRLGSGLLIVVTAAAGVLAAASVTSGGLG